MPIVIWCAPFGTWGALSYLEGARKWVPFGIWLVPLEIWSGALWNMMGALRQWVLLGFGRCP